MPALESLRDEHRVIASVLDALEDYGAELEQGVAASPSSLRRMTAFLAEFVGIWHHGKEEELLMPALVQHGVPSDEPLLAEIREDHTQDENLRQVIEQAALEKESWSAEHRDRIARSIR